MKSFDLSPFHDGLAAGRLVLPRARSGRWLAPGDTSEDDVTWEPASGRGVVESRVVYRRAYRADLEVPYTIAIIRLDEGPRILARLLGSTDAERVEIATTTPLLSFGPLGG